MSQHPESSLQKGDCTAQTCMSVMDNRHAIEQYFAVLKECLENYDLMDMPSQIYNFGVRNFGSQTTTCCH